MTVSDKLIRAKEDYDAVYDKGYSDGAAQGGGGYDQGFAEGKQAEYDAFWDAYQENGNKTNYSLAFAGKGWTAENLKPKYDIKPVILYMMFYANEMEIDLVEWFEKLGVTLDFSHPVYSAQYVFSGSKFTRVGKVDLSIYSGKTNDVFSNMPNLHTIDELVLNEKISRYIEVFTNCTALENIRITGTISANIDIHWSPLTKESIVSLVNALSATASGKTLTLSGTAVNNAFEGGSTGSEWQALIATKQNWTISLV